MTAFVRHAHGISVARVTRWAKPLVAALAAVGILVALAVYVFPTRTWLEQRADTVSSRADLAELERDRAALEARVDALDTDTEIEAIARADYGLVKPGEEAYATLPGASSVPASAPVFPFGDLFAGVTLDNP